MRPVESGFRPSQRLHAAVQVLAAATRAVTDGRSVVISEHRVQRIDHAADSIVTVEQGRVALHSHNSWAPPSPISSKHAHAHRARPGDEAWSLTRVTAGHRGRAVLSEVDLAGRRGEVLALSGPNGGGKTTLLRTIAGSLAPLSGTVARAPGRVAYLPQNPTALLHRPTVRAEVELTLQWAGETEGAVTGGPPSPISHRTARSATPGGTRRHRCR